MLNPANTSLFPVIVIFEEENLQKLLKKEKKRSGIKLEKKKKISRKKKFGKKFGRKKSVSSIAHLE
jgi:hypothetical protein